MNTPIRAGARSAGRRVSRFAGLASIAALASPVFVAPATAAPAARATPAAATPAASGPAAAAPLTEADVRAFMTAMAGAARARDVARLADALADDCAIELRSRVAGRDRTTTFTKAEYLGMLDRGYLALRDLQAYDYEIVDLQVALDDGGHAATVRSHVRESVVLQGRRQVTQSEETTRVVRRNGRPVAVAVSATTSAAD